MKPRLKLIAGTAFGLALMALAARAELVLSGSTAGHFQGTSSGWDVVDNAPDGSTASFRTGNPVGGSFKSGVLFGNTTFSDIHSGDTFGFGMITYYNGITQIGTSSATAKLDFYLDLSNPDLAPFKLTTVTFGIDATTNDTGNVPDRFTATFTQPPPVFINGGWAHFTINSLPPSVDVPENTWVSVANVTVTFTPVPEPATYGLIGALGLMGLAGYRRFRANRGGAGLPPLAAA